MPFLGDWPNHYAIDSCLFFSMIQWTMRKVWNRYQIGAKKGYGSVLWNPSETQIRALSPWVKIGFKTYTHRGLFLLAKISNSLLTVPASENPILRYLIHPMYCIWSLCSYHISMHFSRQQEPLRIAVQSLSSFYGPSPLFSEQSLNNGQ